MSLNDKLLKAAAASGITPSEHFGVVLYEGDGASSHSINGGKFGAAGFFENAGVIQIPDNITNTNEHSFSVWFNVNDASGNQTLLEIDTGNRIIFRIASTDANKANFGNGGWFNHGLSFSANQWYHLAITFKSGSPAKIYVDGSLQYTTGNISKASYGSNNYLGAANGSGSGSVQGKIDQFRVFQKELSSSEVSTLYAETAPESLDPLSEDTTDTLQVLGDSSCLALYKFENNEDDESGNFNGTGTEIQYAAGRYGQAASFNNTTDSKMVIGAQNSVIPNNTTGVSFSFWVYLNTVNTGSDYDHWFVGQENYGGSFENGEFSVRLYEGKVYTDYAQSSSIYRQRKASTVLATGQWHHIVATYDTSNANITEVYLNGVADTSSNITSGGTFTTTALMQNSTNISIGAGPSGTDGRIDQFRIFTKVLSASEVTTLYNENSLVASYRFEGNANDDTRNYDGTASNVTYEYGLGFQPDLVWLKQRDGTAWHTWIDSTRGGSKRIVSNSTSAETTDVNRLTSFDTGGFTLGSDGDCNGDGKDFVAWCFKANGGTTSSNSDGSITTTVQANTAAGFSIITYTGDGASTSTIGHGLDSAPELVLLKTRSHTSDWPVYSSGTTDASYRLVLNSTNGQNTSNNPWNSTAPTSSVINLGSSGNVNLSGRTFVAYAFHSVDGFSKFGSYEGNGSSNGPIVETGFEPAFLMIKNIDSTESGGASWLMYDNKRSTTNPRDRRLFADQNYAEAQNDNYDLDFLSNGFQIKSGTANYGYNNNGNTYIYMAFAADPDTEAPTVAKSFSTVTYTGNGGTQTIEGLGFKPGLIWMKRRDTAQEHALVNIVSGPLKHLYSDLTSAEQTTTNGVSSFNNDGWTMGANGLMNNTNNTYVGWAFKADDNEPTIEGGAAKAVYKFEDNGNDVTGGLNLTESNMSYSSSGKFNKAAEFNGNNSSFTNGSITGLPTGTSPVSMSYWVYTSTSNQNAGLVGYGRWNTGGTNSGAANKYFGTMLASGDLFFAGYYYNTAFSPAVTLPTDQWNHLVWTYDGTNVRAYLNGSLAGTVDRSSLDIGGGSGNLSITIGRNSWSGTGSEHFDGKIDQVRIYSGKLEDEQVSQLYAETSSDNDNVLLGGPPETIISANANAGFSIVQWEGTGTQTQIQHGLSAAPEMIISKRLDSTNNWSVYHKDLSLSHTTYPNWLYLNLTSSEQDSVSSANHPYYAAPSSTVIYQNTGTSESTNVSGGEYISYCFHSVSGYSKIGSYAGNGTTNAITTGFQPDFLLIKVYDNTDQWVIIDSVRGGTKILQPNLSNAESTESGVNVSFTSTGFTHTGSGGGIGQVNTNGNNYIYAAFKIN